jgi:hypothetical protein
MSWFVVGGWFVVLWARTSHRILEPFNLLKKFARHVV